MLCFNMIYIKFKYIIHYVLSSIRQFRGGTILLIFIELVQN